MKASRKKKLFNFRLTSAIALSLIAGILAGVIFAYFSVDGIYILALCAAAAVAVILCAVISGKAEVILNGALVALAFIGGSVYAYFICAAFIADGLECGKWILVSGSVDKVGVTSGGKTYLVLSGCVAGGVRSDGKIVAYLGENAGDYCAEGYKVSFFTALGKESLFEDGELTYNACNGIKYYCSVKSGLRAEWGFSLFGRINGAIRGALFNNLDDETASVCFAMLTGDSSSISEGTLTSFRYGGIAHLFAVSGLHIGVIFGALTLLFKLFPVNRFISAAVRLFAVIFYAGICGFSPSSVRAVCMCAVSVIAFLSYRKNDGLSSLSVAAVVSLLINPLYLFGAGFLLSFGAVLGIVMLGRNIQDALFFLPDKLGEAISVGISAQLATAPVQFASFGYISWAGLFLNILIIPIVSAAYMLLFACVMISVIIPPVAGALVPFAALPIDGVINAIVTCGFENAVIRRDFGLWIYAPFVLLLCGLSDKFNIGPACRSTLCSAALVGLCVGFVL